MADDVFRRYLETGIAFTNLTRARAEAIVRELVRAGEVQRDQATERVEELLERNRRNSDQLLDLVRREISEQLRALGLATRDDVAELNARLDELANAVEAGSQASDPADPPTRPAGGPESSPVSPVAAAAGPVPAAATAAPTPAAAAPGPTPAAAPTPVAPAATEAGPKKR